MALDALDIGGAQDSGDEGIFGEVLEVPPAQGGTLDVDGRTQENIDREGAGFSAQGFADFLYEVGVPA